MSLRPDCVLLTLDEASALLEDARVAFAVTDISPENRTCRYDQPRVVRQVLDSQGVLDLTVADFIARPVEPVAQATLSEAPPSGVYVLEMRPARARHLQVGALGPVKVHSGTYLYVGSAKKGLPQRLARHFAAEKTARWHIDYLTQHVRPARAIVWDWKPGMECAIAGQLAAMGRTIAGFGCSDCGCEAHLFALRRPSHQWWAEAPELPPPTCIIIRPDTQS